MSVRHKLQYLPKLEDLSCTVKFQWVPAHTGLTENEHADELAKKGRQKQPFSNLAELSDITAITENKIKPGNSVDFKWKTPVAKMSVNRKASTRIVQLRSKRTEDFQITNGNRYNYGLCKKCQQQPLSPEQAFQCNFVEKVKQFGFMSLDKAQKEVLDVNAMAEFVNKHQDQV